jgi:hypothetical protein
MVEGNLSADEAGRLFSGLGLGDGSYSTFSGYEAAAASMRAQQSGTRFGVGYLNPGEKLGHIVAGRNTSVGLVFRDFQASGLPWVRPQGASGNATFTVFTF